MGLGRTSIKDIQRDRGNRMQLTPKQQKLTYEPDCITQLMPTLLCNRFCNQEFNAESSLQFPHYRPLCQCFPMTGATGADVLAPNR